MFREVLVVWIVTWVVHQCECQFEVLVMYRFAVVVIALKLDCEANESSHIFAFCVRADRC